jgi:hypothetical protein
MGKNDEPVDWDDAPTEIRIPKAPPAVGVAEADQTDQYPVASQRAPHTEATLPSFLDVSLHVMSGPVAGGPFALKMVETLIGRGTDAQIRIQDMMMSKRHASIRYVDGEFRIRDEKSSNGTFLNGSKVVEYAVRDGDKLLIGDTLFRFRLGRA